MTNQMKFKGIYVGHSLPGYELKREKWYSHVKTEKGELRIIVSYDETNDTPFLVKQIAVQLKEGFTTIRWYDVFEGENPFQTLDEVKTFAHTFTENLLQYRKALLSFFAPAIKENLIQI